MKEKMHTVAVRPAKVHDLETVALAKRQLGGRDGGEIVKDVTIFVRGMPWE